MFPQGYMKTSAFKFYSSEFFMTTICLGDNCPPSYFWICCRSMFFLNFCLTLVIFFLTSFLKIDFHSRQLLILISFALAIASVQQPSSRLISRKNLISLGSVPGSLCKQQVYCACCTSLLCKYFVHVII